MNKNISFDKFRYWLISLDLLEKDPEVWKILSERHVGENSVTSYWPSGRPAAVRSIYILHDKARSKKTSKIYVDFNRFLENRLILTFMKLNAKSVSILASNKNASTKWKYFCKLQQKLLLSYYHHPDYIGEGNQSILNKDINSQYPLIHSPLVLYMEPTENNLLLNSQKNISQDKIRYLIKMLESHGSLWSIINGFVVMTFLYTEYPWRSFIFLNTNQLAKNDNKIHLPDIIYDLLKQIACYHWLAYRKNQLLESDLSKFNSQVLTSAKNLKDISKTHKQVLSSLGQFYEYNIKLLDELPLIKNFNTSFLNYLRIINIEEPDAERFRGPSTAMRFMNEVTDSLESIDHHIEKLISKTLMFSNFSRDMLNTRISKINLTLQKVLIFLTIILAILTGVFAWKSLLV